MLRQRRNYMSGLRQFYSNISIFGQGKRGCIPSNIEFHDKFLA
jgi:hypothetical protein